MIKTTQIILNLTQRASTFKLTTQTLNGFALRLNTQATN